MQLRSHGGLLPALRNRRPGLSGRLPPHGWRNFSRAVAGDGEGGAGSLQVSECESQYHLLTQIGSGNFMPFTRWFWSDHSDA